MTSWEAEAVQPPEKAAALPRWVRSAARAVLQLLFVYVVLLAVHAFLGRWTPDYLQGRDLWHFWFSRMVVPMVMLGIFVSAARLIPAGIMLAAGLLFFGTISAIKREATGEPFQVSDLFLTGQSMHLLNYVQWHHWLLGATVIPAGYFFLRNLRLRWWSVPVALVFVALLATYRIEAVAKWIHANSWWIGVENLTFSQAESERMNGFATHLYFSTAGLRLKTHAEAEVARALEALDAPAPAAAASGPAPDVYLILGEAWWRDPHDKASPLDQLSAAGFAESSAVSPVYGGTTPNAEFEVLTGIPVKSFQAGIIPYQHYVQYITDASVSLPRLLAGHGYAATAYHNFTRRFWLRDQVYPKLGFDRFVSMEEMTLVIQANDWPTDAGLYQSVLKTVGGERPQFQFIVTVETHGPYAKDPADVEGHNGVQDYRRRLDNAAQSLVAFKRELDGKGRPYVIVLFGDHLPGLRLHQWKNGMKSETDPRLRQVPLLIASNVKDASRFAEDISGRPLYCMPSMLLGWIGQPVADRYMNYAGEKCRGSATPMLMPAEAVIQNQLFSQKPL
ncbi:MAG: LTA synthase family protein [Aestuariivirga sp.]|nr:LTA synthase family protein [Aestuariivirga sp.]